MGRSDRRGRALAFCPSAAIRVAALMLGIAVLGACDDSVDPTLGTEQAFSIYGFLDPTADRQALRVVPIAGDIDADTSRTIDAVVTSVDLGSGQEVVWRDSTVAFDDGSIGHVFVADYTPLPGATVEVRVQETTGAQRTTTVRTTLPPLTRPEVGTGSQENREVTYPIRIEGAERVLATSLVFYVTGAPSAPADTIALYYDDPPQLEPVGAGRWGLDLPFIATASAFLSSPDLAGRRLTLVEVGIRAFVASRDWAVPPLSDDALVEPGTFTNVLGGFGFVGAGYWTSTRWTPSLTTQARAGFYVADDPASVLVINEISAAGWIEIYNPAQEAVSVSGYVLDTPSGSVTIPVGTLVPPLGFHVESVGSTLTSGSITLSRPAGDVVVETFAPPLPKPAFGTYGSYPDGRSKMIRDYDLFRGFLRTTMGEPNEPNQRLVLINEVYTAGSSGWVETIRQFPAVMNIRVTTDTELALGDWPQVGGFNTLGSVSEDPIALDLPQGGGEIFVIAQPATDDPPPPRVYDVRSYGPQDPSSSSGLLPDGGRSSWQRGLTPTRDRENVSPASRSRSHSNVGR